MKSIVQVEGSKVFTTSLILAEGVGIEHRAVLQLIKTHAGTKTLAPSAFEMRKQKTLGRPTEYAILTELQATFLITLMRNSEKVVDFKERLTNEFFRQRQIIAELLAQRSDKDWQQVRKDGKHVYHQKVDVIKQFVDYATSQGSSSAKMYYMNLAKMENSALFFFEQKYPNMREVMTIRQLMQVATADTVIEKALLDGMSNNLPYKEVYALAKERVQAFAEIIGRSQILGFEPTKKLT